MTRLITYILCMLVAAAAAAQVDVSGTVIDKERGEPLTGASVIVKGADGKIKKIHHFKNEGQFYTFCAICQGVPP